MGCQIEAVALHVLGYVAHEKDHGGRPLPFWQGCRVIGHGEIFLMNPDEPESLDGRYFGPLPIASIAGLAEPLWTLSAGPIMRLECSRTPPGLLPCRHS